VNPLKNMIFPETGADLLWLAIASKYSMWRRFAHCMARRSEFRLARASITGHGMNLRCSESELAVASLTGQNLHIFENS
jgi:hypothetical protein